MDHLSENSGIPNQLLVPSYRFVAPDLQGSVTGNVEQLLMHGDLKEKLTRLLTANPEQREFDVQQLLEMKLSQAESIAAVTILEAVIERRWKDGNYLMHYDPSSLDLGVFEDLPMQDYEWMPTRVHPDSFWGGIGKLHLNFPAGLQESKTVHTHPGARIVVSTGRRKFTAPSIGDDFLHLDNGTIVLMPGNLPHNFCAYDDEDWKPVSFHLPYAGIGKEAMEF
ncbi:hypothetical protein A3D88_02010 [Candidatus Peribacteria bacterium RIFCSPHIGHO2_02_FULL_52_16]|nr:MAG: hypothetical protein A2706_05205 [Candidatus Peribacteria bacterium RIFCSPHIGHO2_01_FULL_51_35]OGJ61158.1 MAG: hypothetical protein A3D88_02010 [Candidatus Peribacteria bacterium RIFCSPHIGHO2_02_FULL_52_16]